MPIDKYTANANAFICFGLRSQMIVIKSAFMMSDDYHLVCPSIRPPVKCNDPDNDNDNDDTERHDQRLRQYCVSVEITGSSVASEAPLQHIEATAANNNSESAAVPVVNTAGHLDGLIRQYTVKRNVGGPRAKILNQK